MAFEKIVPQWNAAGTEPPEDLKNSGFTPGYKPPAAFFNWFWHGMSEAVAELQGMTPADIGAERNLYLGAAPVDTVTDDTFVKWANIGTGYAFYGASGLLNGQPSTYGYLLNIATPSNVAQLWLALPQGTMYYRGGNSSSLATSWTKVLNSAQINEILLNNLGGTLSVEKGGTGKTNTADAYKELSKRASIHDSNMLDANTLSSPGVHQVYVEDMTISVVDYNFPYRYGILIVDGYAAYVSQTFYSLAEKKMYYRTSHNQGVEWTDWHKVYDTGNKPTAADIGLPSPSTSNAGKALVVDENGKYALGEAGISEVSADMVQAGTLAGKVQANKTAAANLTAAQVRDVVMLTTDPGAGASVSYPNGTVILVYE